MSGNGYRLTSSSSGEWPTITIPVEWYVADETGLSSGPIRQGQIVGGKFDGADLTFRVQGSSIIYGRNEEG